MKMKIFKRAWTYDSLKKFTYETDSFAFRCRLEIALCANSILYTLEKHIRCNVILILRNKNVMVNKTLFEARKKWCQEKYTTPKTPTTFTAYFISQWIN